MAEPGTTTTLLQRRDCLGTLARFWQRTYATDYITLLFLIALEILIQAFITPFHRLFALSDLAIQYPHADPEHVPPLLLLVYAVLVPLATLTLWAVLTRPGAHKTHVTFLGLLLSLFLTTVLTDLVKNAVGRPRPDLLSRCKPRAGTPRDKLVGVEVCEEKAHHLLHDGWRSFPSGHSSSAFAGLGYLALVLAAQSHALRPGTPLPLALLPLVPIVGAALIAISRTEDYRHDVFDVCTGSLLGAAVALGCYRRYYPSLWGWGAERPFEVGVGREGGGKRRRKDEEFALGSESEGEYERLEGGGRRGSGAR